MVNPQTAVGSNNFKIDFGGNEEPQFYNISLPTISIPVLEHEVGSKQPYPLKHADQADYGGTFTCELFAQGSKSAVDKWWDRLKQYKEKQNQKSISVTLQDPNGKNVLRWEFTDATLVSYEYKGQLSGGDAMKISIDVSYQRMDRKVP
jgi:phage tail-like protein